jgi:hypothetical protein
MIAAERVAATLGGENFAIACAITRRWTASSTTVCRMQL